MEFLDLSPVLETVINVGAAMLLGAGSWAAKRLADRLGIEAESDLSRRLQDAVGWAVSYARSRAVDQGADLARVEVRNAVVADAIGYIGGHVPQTVRRLGLTDAAVAEMVEARLSR
ncbi:hypothetical protein [Fodinicurvata sp. EGI_FJ10296]|uniref:hypothetical protein n=1 Tax=Fodinicurvata sp. EGI_FJ10296 TaxID=3231908 RepID=UPI0034514441